MNRCLIATFLSVAAAACAQERETGTSKPAPQQEQAARELAAEIQAQFAAEGIRVDGKARTVTIDAVMNQPPDPIEYLLIHRRGKRHEAMFITRSKPSILNAALLLIGLQPGKNASYVEKDPPPTLDEIEQGADPIVVTPPAGLPFWITVRHKDEAGKVVEHCVEDLILDLHTGRPVEQVEWIFLGGRMAALYKNEPDVFVADFEGNLVSVCYMAPDNHLATMKHARARDDQNWWVTEQCPAPGTELEVVFHAAEPKLSKERTKRLLEEASRRDQGEPQGGKQDQGK